MFSAAVPASAGDYASHCAAERVSIPTISMVHVPSLGIVTPIRAGRGPRGVPCGHVDDSRLHRAFFCTFCRSARYSVRAHLVRGPCATPRRCVAELAGSAGLRLRVADPRAAAGEADRAARPPRA